jgi:hypothetical protein
VRVLVSSDKLEGNERFGELNFHNIKILVGSVMDAAEFAYVSV